MPTIEDIKRDLEPGKKTSSFLIIPRQEKVENLIPDDFNTPGYDYAHGICYDEEGRPYYRQMEGEDRARAVLDNSRLTGKPRQNLE